MGQLLDILTSPNKLLKKKFTKLENNMIEYVQTRKQKTSKAGIQEEPNSAKLKQKKTVKSMQNLNSNKTISENIVYPSMTNKRNSLFFGNKINTLPPIDLKANSIKTKKIKFLCCI